MNHALTCLLLALFGLAVAVTTSILVAINGWGLEPKSWWWIIGANVLGQLFAQFVGTVAKKEVGK